MAPEPLLCPLVPPGASWCPLAPPVPPVPLVPLVPLVLISVPGFPIVPSRDLQVLCSPCDYRLSWVISHFKSSFGTRTTPFHSGTCDMPKICRSVPHTVEMRSILKLQIDIFRKTKLICAEALLIPCWTTKTYHFDWVRRIMYCRITYCRITYRRNRFWYLP